MNHRGSIYQKECPQMVSWKLAKFSIFATGLTILALIRTSNSQHHSLLNTPPILYVPERNWRISEAEKVGQIIARIRAEDAENDVLVFGLEPHFHENYANPNSDVGSSHDQLPFRIDPVEGIVYLNDSLAGRAGENFFLYITVSDGQLTAKNEILVNILPTYGNKIYGIQSSPSFPTNVQNISHFLPAFDQLPGVQSIKNTQPNNRPTISMIPSLGINPPIFPSNRFNVGAGSNSFGTRPSITFSSNHHIPSWASPNNSGEQTDDIEFKDKSTIGNVTTTQTRIRLAPINDKKKNYNKSSSEKQKNSTLLSLPSKKNDTINNNNAYDTIETSATASSKDVYSLRAIIIPVVLSASVLFVAAAFILIFLYRRRLCVLSETLKKKSKEEMAKELNQSNMSNNLNDESRNSMVMQQWHGPIAYGNRYVPWERDQQLSQICTTTTQISPNSAFGGGPTGGQTCAANSVCGVPNTVSSRQTHSKHDQWEFPRHRLKFFNILGEGAFGQVWRCEATDINEVGGVTTVAVKTLKESATAIEKKDLVSELEVMKSLEPHMNVVLLLGCCTEKDPIFVIIEYINCGKLQTYLRNSRAERHYGNTFGKSNVLTSGDLTSFMYQVAKGMEYLTSRGIIHRDLAARNILITDNRTCKVADFGFARDVITSHVYERKSEGKLPIRWMAIESLYDNIFSVKTDVWSFGILMWEIVTLGSTPYPGISAADVMRKVRDGYRLEKPEHCRRELYNIMYYCWSKDAMERPSFSEIVQMLDKLLHTEMEYIELERFPDHNYYNILNLSGEKL